MSTQVQPDPIHWHWDAACAGVDPEVFFPVHRDRRKRAVMVNRAIAVCVPCRVRKACAATALRRNVAHGVVAGVDLGDNWSRLPAEEAAELLRAVAEGRA